MADQLSRAGKLDIVIEQGATFRLGFVHGVRVATDSGDSYIQPTDLTGCTVRAQVREGYGEPILLSALTEATSTPVLDADGQPVLDADGEPTVTTVPAGIVLDDPERGHLVLTWTAAQTDTLDGITRAVYDMEIAFPSGDVQRVLEGKVTVSPNITR